VRGRKNSWDAPSIVDTAAATPDDAAAARLGAAGMGQHRRDPSWETITVGARLSGGEWSMFAATHHNNSSTVAVPLAPPPPPHEPMPPAARATTLAAALAYASAAASASASPVRGAASAEAGLEPERSAAADVAPKAARFGGAEANAGSHQTAAAAGGQRQPAGRSAAAGGDEDDWFADAPQVAVARSLSVTRANSQRAIAVVRPVRSSSRQVHANHILSSRHAAVKLAAAQAQASSSTTSLLSSASSSSLSSAGPVGAVKPVAGPARPVDGPSPSPSSPAVVVVDGPSRSASRRQDLQRELFGERGLGERRGLSVAAVVSGVRAAGEERVREIGAQLTPRMCVVEEEENRKSVWGLIESA
jgi:hypothetical protein